MSAQVRHRHRPGHDQQRAGLRAAGRGAGARPGACPFRNSSPPATVEARSMLPSFLYLGTEQEAKSGNFALPWEKRPHTAVGELARKQAAEVPTRTVAAAKSWLAHSRVDRHQAILPWNAPADVPKVSPVAASRRYLEHLVAAWEAAFPDAPIAEQHVVLTVPASFDASARELTREAALAAGLPDSLLLLEEPQAAVYAWLADMGDRWRRQLKVGDTLLVCDVGGGTTDFTLIGVDRGSRRAGPAPRRGRQPPARRRRQHGPGPGPSRDRGLRREGHQARSVAIGVALALLPHGQGDAARRRRSQEASGHRARPRQPLIGRRSRSTSSAKPPRSCSIDGFFPQCEASTRPARRTASGFHEIGLPFESDTAHHAAPGGVSRRPRREPDSPARPTHVLFNGGVFKAEPSAQPRAWKCSPPGSASPAAPRGLEANHDLDHAVARGAAYYGLAKQGKGVRIRGGTARSYYVGIETRRPGHSRRRAPAAGTVRRPLRHGGRDRGRRARRRDRPGRRRAGPVPLLQLRRAQGGPARRRCSPAGPRTSSPKPIRWKPRCPPPRRWKTTTCPCASTAASPSSACSSCGAPARSATSAGSWSSASATTRKLDAVRHSGIGLSSHGHEAA